MGSQESIPPTIVAGAVTEHRKGILVSGIMLVRGLLKRFMNNGSAQSGTMLVSANSSVEPFLKSLFAEVDEAVAKQGFYARSFGRDAEGPFIKTNVEVSDLKGEPYVPNGILSPFLLGLYAAHVEAAVEEWLARAVGCQRGLVRCQVDLQVSATGQPAIIDVASVLDPVRGMLDIPTHRDQVFAEAMMPTTRNGGLNQVTLWTSPCRQFKVVLEVNNLSLMPAAFAEQQFIRKGVIVTATRRSRVDVGVEGELVPLRLHLSVVSKNRWRQQGHRPMPVLHFQAINAMRSLTMKLARSYPP